MPVIKVERTKNYTVMSNYHLQDKNISLKAKGLLSYMLSLPEYWEYSINGLASICKEGPDCIRTTIKELEDNGYITRNRIRSENGKLGAAEYIIRERPVDEVKQEQPILENPTQDITVQINTNVVNNVSKKECNNIYISLFDEFWRLYPRRVGKTDAFKAWKKLKPDNTLLTTMIIAINKQKQTEQWQNEKFIPYPASWLNGRRWEDEIPEPKDCRKNDGFDDFRNA